MKWFGQLHLRRAWKLPLDQWQPPMSYAGMGPCPNDWLHGMCTFSLLHENLHGSKLTYGSFQLLSVPRLNVCMQICQSRNEFQSWSREDHRCPSTSFNTCIHLRAISDHFRSSPSSLCQCPTDYGKIRRNVSSYRVHPVNLYTLEVQDQAKNVFSFGGMIHIENSLLPWQPWGKVCTLDFLGIDSSRFSLKMEPIKIWRSR